MILNRALSLALFSLLAAPAVLAQQAPPAPPAAAGAPAPPARHSNRTMEAPARHDGQDRGGMGIVPPGTWWKNPAVVTALSLTADQQKKLDDTFLQSRISLIHLHASLEEEQLKLEPLLNANPPDQAKSLAEISKIADLRADLEKANAKMLLSLRGILTADQWTKLQTEQHNHHDGMDEGRGAGKGMGHGPSGGPQGPGAQGSGPQGRGPQGPGPQASFDPEELYFPAAPDVVVAN
jgi:Spy/CpxP family protein refolding chaperone